MSCLFFSSFLRRIVCGLCSLSLHLLGGLGEVGEGLTALELGVLNDTWRHMLVLKLTTIDKKQSIPASASDEKLAVHWTKVLFSFSPEVTA
jgi:hypothetical protein